jgi:hypothetical protein
MTLASILHELDRLPLADRIFVVEQVSTSIEAEKARSIRAEVESVSEDYRPSQDSTESTRRNKEKFAGNASKTELAEKLTAGLHLAYKRMLEFKRQKNSEVVVMRDGKIVRIKP